MTAGNVVFGGLIGLGIDAASGAMNTYDPNVEIIMTPAAGVRQPASRGQGSAYGERAGGRARLRASAHDIAFRSNEGSAKRAAHSGRALYA
jgi:hypothetical protein